MPMNYFTAVCVFKDRNKEKVQAVKAYGSLEVQLQSSLTSKIDEDYF